MIAGLWLFDRLLWKNITHTVRTHLLGHCPALHLSIGFAHSAFRVVLHRADSLLSGVQLVGGQELNGRRIDAIALACRWRSVLEHVAHVRAALGAPDLGANALWVFNKQ